MVSPGGRQLRARCGSGKEEIRHRQNTKAFSGESTLKKIHSEKKEKKK
jgi:hypothetical protein